MTFRDIAHWIIRRRDARDGVHEVAVHDVGREEIIAEIDRLARKRCGISAHDLLSGYRAGTLSTRADVSDLIAYADLLAANDPIFESASRTAEPTAHYALR
jgi:hypothetical protein